VNFDRFWAVDADLVTDASVVSFGNGYVPGAMSLVMPVRTLVMNNRTSRPAPAGLDVQLFSLDGTFTLSQNAWSTTTNVYVVQFTPGSSITVNILGYTLRGANLVTDLPRTLRNGNPSEELGETETQAARLNDEERRRLRQKPAVEKVSSGQAVNLEMR
jgi:hypothetical protein